MAEWKQLLTVGDAATDNIGSADQTVSGNRDLNLGTNTFTITAGSPGAGENQQGLSMAEDSAFTITSPSTNIKSDSTTTPGQLRLEGVLGYYVGLQCAAADASNTVYTLPNGQSNPPTTGDCLISSSTGTLSWSARLEKENPSASGALTVNNVQDGTTGQARIQIEDYSGGQYVSIDAPNTVSSNYTITLPGASPGAANKILESDASGNLSWIDTPSGSGSGISNVVEDTTPQLGGHLDTNGFRVQLDNNIPITGDNTSATRLNIAKVNTSNHIEFGQATVDAFHLGDTYLDRYVFDDDGTTSDGSVGNGGQVTLYGTNTSTTAGRAYYYNSSGGWSFASVSAADANASLLAVATGNPSTRGMLLRGVVQVSNGGTNLSTGKAVYLTTNGSFTTTVPTTSGHYARIVGYALDTNTIFFTPSNDYIEIA